ncbi:MAG: radical SAM protein, partial [Deltaproteobacteria bacterium]|nr:radical SAM protein [Deltaproteobacteria bacterium]
VRFRKVESVLDEIELLVRNFGTREINFAVETFTLKKDYTIALCEGILKRRIKVRWQAPTRVDCVDLELLRLMNRAGCWQLRFGLESGNQRILDLMKKNITLGMVESAVGMAQKVGMRTVGYFILGYVDENAQSVNNTIQFAKKLDLDSAVFYLGVPYYKTNFHDLAVERGLIDANYWPEWVMGRRTDPLPFLIPDAEKWLQRAYSDYYYRPKYILKRLRTMRSPQDMCENLVAGSSLLLTKIRRQFQQ